MADNFKMYVSKDGSKEETPTVYEDRLPDGVSEEDLKAEYGKLVWCKFRACMYNQEVEGLQRTTGTIRKNSGFKPLSEKDAVWTGLCTRTSEIAIDFTTITTPGGYKQKVPSCHVSSSNSKGERHDWSKLLQSDGTPYGGSTESRTAEHDWDKHGDWYN